VFLHFLQTKEQKEAFLELAHRVAKADGIVNWKEQGYLRSYMYEMNMVAPERISSSERELKDIIKEIPEESVRTIFLLEILMLVYADGDYNEDEQRIARELQALFGFSNEKLESCRNWVKSLDNLKIEGIKLIL